MAEKKKKRRGHKRPIVRDRSVPGKEGTEKKATAGHPHLPSSTPWTHCGRMGSAATHDRCPGPLFPPSSLLSASCSCHEIPRDGLRLGEASNETSRLVPPDAASQADWPGDPGRNFKDTSYNSFNVARLLAVVINSAAQHQQDKNM